MQKWSYFSMGIMAGIIAVLFTVVVSQNREPQAYAAPAPAAQAVDNTGQGLMLATGGATANQADVLWVINKHKAAGGRAGADSKDVVASKDERITLCCYQVLVGCRKIRLVGVRDISFDMDLIELENDKPTVKEIVETLRKAQPKPEK